MTSMEKSDQAPEKDRNTEIQKYRKTERQKDSDTFGDIGRKQKERRTDRRNLKERKTKRTDKQKDRETKR